MEGSKEAEIGIIGLGVMASSYSRNLYFRGFKLSVWTRNEKEIENFNFKLQHEMKSNSSNKVGTVKCFINLDEFLDSLKTPRKIIMLVTAGNPTDSMVYRLLPLLEPDDLLVDGGNEWFKKTNMRITRCKDTGIRFVHGIDFSCRFAGMGISGGERGSRNSPCFMFGGSMDDYEILKPILSQDGKDFYVGPGPSGHYVKMVHNGIEYAILQAICEVYKILKFANGMNNEQIADMLRNWNLEINSYLLKITSMILTQKEGEGYLLDKITPCISSNGTGRWTVHDAIERAIPLPSIGIAVDMRGFSNIPASYVKCNYFDGNKTPKYEKFDTGGFKELIEAEDLKTAFVCTLIAIFSQGLHLLTESSKAFEWGLRLETIADIWSRNSIISCKLLEDISESYKVNEKILISHPRFRERLLKGMRSWKNVSKNCLENDLTAPTILSSLQYVQVLYSENHCYNLIQAQRDCFGAHSFERIDKPGKYHYNWWKEYK